MQRSFAIVAVLALPLAAFAQDKAIQDAIDQKLVTIRYVLSLQTPNGGFAAAVPAGDVKPTPGLRATSAAVRSLKYLTGKPVKEAVPNADKTAAFVLSCFDPTTGGFADTPGGKPDVTLTSVGVMAAVELGIPKEKYAKAMDYLKENAKSFEDVRIGAAAVEAWGVKDCPFDLEPWFKVADEYYFSHLLRDSIDASALGSVMAFNLRLGRADKKSDSAGNLMSLDQWQNKDGSWKSKLEDAHLEPTYRVMRAYHLLGEKPRRSAALREFVGKCRNADGGYGVKPGEASSAGGTYYATIISKWLDEMEKK